MSTLENILAFIFLLNWGIIWNLERWQIACNEDWHLLFSPVSTTHHQSNGHSHFFFFFKVICSSLELALQPQGSHPERQWWLVGCWVPPFRADLDDRTRLFSWAWLLISCVTVVSSRVMTSLWLHPQHTQPPPGRVLYGIACLKLILALTYVRRSNACVFHAVHYSYDLPIQNWKLPPWCGRLIALHSLIVLNLTSLKCVYVRFGCTKPISACYTHRQWHVLHAYIKHTAVWVGSPHIHRFSMDKCTC